MKCPFCAETIKGEAKVCRYCGRKIPPPTPEASERRRHKKILFTMGAVSLVIVALAVAANQNHEADVLTCKRALLWAHVPTDQCMEMVREHGRSAVDIMVLGHK